VPYPQKLLRNDEQIVLDLHPHLWYLFPRLLVMVAAIVAGIWAAAGGAPTFLQGVIGVLVVVATGWWLVRLAAYLSTNFVLTTDRVIYRTGVLRKTGIEIPLERINTVFFEQRIWERIIKAGNVAVESAGESGRTHFTDIRNPEQVVNEIHTQMDANEDRGNDRVGEAAARGVAGGGLSNAEQLEKLAALHASGALTDAEFEAQKQKLLS
jgi:uncharacterized membrane protein YdbT with pleckstrin-like domain